MEKRAFALLQLLACALCVSGLMKTGLSDHRNATKIAQMGEASCITGIPSQGTRHCNETLMLERLPACGKTFEDVMKKVDSRKWCNLTEFIMHYDTFSQCTEKEANRVGCFWPNPHAEVYITAIHKLFFSNCTSDKVVWEDPPDEILTTLILVPVFLTAAMITLVVWRSK